MNRKNPFVAGCTTLWGPVYQSVAARELGISRSSVVRYAADARRAPPEILDRLVALIEQRSDDVAKVLPDLIRRSVAKRK